jgi:hypothetical protein
MKTVFNRTIDSKTAMKKLLAELQNFLKIRKGKSYAEMLDYEVEHNINFSEWDHETFGIRYHKKKDEIEIGANVPNSYEHYDGEGHKEMSATSAIWINTDTDFEKALDDIETYYEDDRELILIGGDDWGEGLDYHVNERQIANAVRIA